MAQIFLRSIDTRSVQTFIQEVGRFPRISNEQARLLATLARKGSENAKESLVNSSMWYVVQIALRYKNQVFNAELGDLIQDGSIGLLAAVEKYQPQMRTGFLKFATIYIEDSITSGLDEYIHSIRLPHTSCTLLRKIAKIESAYYQEYGFAPTIDELMEQTGATRDHIYAVMHTDVDSFESEEFNGEADVLEAEPTDVYHAQYNKERVASLMHLLGHREQYIIIKLFGLDGEEMNMKDVAAQLGLTSERVRQLKEKALGIMRQKMAA